MKSKIEKRVLVIVMAVLLLAVFSGCSFFTGPAGEDGGNVPGGTVTVLIDSALFTPETTIRIVFDENTLVLNGSEAFVNLPLADYIGSGYLTLTWKAPDLNPGSYYVYYWVDLDGDRTINGDESSDVYHPGNDYSINVSLTPMEIVSSSGYKLFPNYTSTVDFAPFLELSPFGYMAF